MNRIHSRSVFMSLMIAALIVAFFPAGSVQAQCENCKCDYTCQLKSKNTNLKIDGKDVLSKTLNSCRFSKKAFEGDCRLCEGIDVCTQTGSWFKKCEDAGGSWVQVKCLCYYKKIGVFQQKPDQWDFGCKTRNTKIIIGPFGMPIFK